MEIDRQLIALTAVPPESGFLGRGLAVFGGADDGRGARLLGAGGARGDADGRGGGGDGVHVRWRVTSSVSSFERGWRQTSSHRLHPTTNFLIGQDGQLGFGFPRLRRNRGPCASSCFVKGEDRSKRAKFQTRI